MKRNAIKIIIAFIAYGGLTLAIALYIVMNIVISTRAGLFDQLEPAIVTGFISSIVSLVANVVTIVKYRGVLRTLSIFGVLLSLAIIALFVPPLAFSVPLG